MAEPRLNLGKATVLLVQNSSTELDILGQMFIGFGVKGIRKCTNVEDADSVAGSSAFDLLVVDCDIPDGAGFDFVARLRRMEENANRLAPVLLICGHTPGQCRARPRLRRELRGRQADHPADHVRPAHVAGP